MKNIALVGNPNCGKSTLFNALTGSKQKTANYSGVTVEKKEGFFSTENKTLFRIFDLPGIYSLNTPRTPDELVTYQILLGELKNKNTIQPHSEDFIHLDAIIFVSDATQLDLNLSLLLELKTLSIPIIVALNMVDLIKKQGVEYNLTLLTEAFSVPFIPVVATKKLGIEQLIKKAEDLILQMPSLKKEVSSAKILNLTPEILRENRKKVIEILNSSRIQQMQKKNLSDTLDSFFLHPIYGIVILVLVLFSVFQAVFTWATIPKEILENAVEFIQNWMLDLLPKGLLQSLIVDGVIAGVGSIIVFIPQILILLFFVYLLESSGYMARAAFLLDRLMNAVGLHGKAFIPLLSSFACAIPAIMATRTIERRRDRLITILITPLMSCSARIPVYALIIAAFIPQRKIFYFLELQGFVMFVLYFAGIFAALCISFVLNKILFKGEPEPLLIQLPSYKLPSLSNIFFHLLEKIRSFVVQAGTILLAMVIVIWFLSVYPSPPALATLSPIHYTYAGMLGRWLEPFFAPLGFHWQIVVALIPGMAAREVAVGALGTVYSLSGNEEAVRESLAQTILASWSLPTALSLLAWYVFAPQCISTLAVVKRETQSWLWPSVVFFYMVALAYCAAFVTFRIASYCVSFSS
ncbi:MAG: ferrous iron transporter B [Silvanigrellaceae bacterium]|nr:ferrous iron transporter B [Silvanigrellaceae bacterium]